MGLFLVGYSCLLDGKTSLVGFDVLVETCYVFCCRSDFYTCIAGKYLLVEVISQAQLLSIVDEVACEQGNTPSTTFACSLHDRDRGVDGCCENALTYTLGLEQTAMTGNAVYLYLLVLEQYIVANLQYGY